MDTETELYKLNGGDLVTYHYPIYANLKLDLW